MHHPAGPTHLTRADSQRIKMGQGHVPIHHAAEADRLANRPHPQNGVLEPTRTGLKNHEQTRKKQQEQSDHDQ